MDVQGQLGEMEVPYILEQAPPEADPASLQRASQLLLSGRRVAVLAGTGVHRSSATAELTRLAETMGIPVFTTPEGKGAMPEDHPLCLGVHGGMTSRANTIEDPLQAFLDRLDTLLVVGCSLSIARTKDRGLRLPGNLVHVDIDGESIGKVYETAVGVVGDAKVVLKQINSAIKGRPAGLEAGFDGESRALKKTILETRWRMMPNQMKTMEAIREVAARDAIFAGRRQRRVHRGANYCLPIYEPRAYMISHWGGLGFAFPAALGAKAALPGRQVVCLTGDGGFQFNMQELGTCVQYGLNPVVLVFNDNAWGVLKSVQKNHYDGRYIASELQNPDFARLAQAYGANGVRVASLRELVAALESALKSDTVTVIDVRTPQGFANFT